VRLHPDRYFVSTDDTKWRASSEASEHDIQLIPGPRRDGASGMLSLYTVAEGEIWILGLDGKRNWTYRARNRLNSWRHRQNWEEKMKIVERPVLLERCIFNISRQRKTSQ